MEIEEIASKLKAKFQDKCVISLSDPRALINNLLTDSRNHFNPEKSLFFAIKTPGGNDGHKYMDELKKKGVKNFVAEYLPENFDKENINLFIVPNTIEALSEIGKFHLENAKEIVGITGSRGKTTIKEMLFQLLEPYYNISRSPRSFNSKVGVPLSLWQIKPSTDIALIEAGISMKGEMQRLSAIINPDTVIFNNIGEAHSHGFSSQQEKAEEKAFLLSSNVNTVIYPFDNELIKNAINKLSEGKKLIGWSTKNHEAELYLKIKPASREGEFKLEYSWEDKTNSFNINLFKDYDLENLAASLAFMLKEGFSSDVIKERFANLKRINTRLNVSEGVNGCSIILDSYTSDLSSLQPAIDFMMRRRMPSQTLSLIVSDLLHGVENEEETYQEMAKLVRETGITRFIGIGEKLMKYSNLFPEKSKFYPDVESFLKEMSLTDFNDEIILMKGSYGFDFEKIHEMFEAKKHETVLEVNLDAILRNYNYFRSKVPSTTGMIAMVKASGYGAGSFEIAKTLQDAGASYLAVAALDEGIDLRKNGIVMPVMIMNPRAANYSALFKNRLEPVIFTMSMLKDLSKEAEKYGVGNYPVHIKLDTGMHRMGFTENEIDEVIDLLSNCKFIRVSSVFSHLATADCLDMDEFTLRQLGRFDSMSTKIVTSFDYYVKRHILNSAGILRFPEYHYDLVRLGIGLYGANTLPPEIEKPLSVVSTLRSVIICIREIEEGEAVGYSRKGKIEGKGRIATIPIGYADGMNRHFGNGGTKVLVNGQLAPTIGNICMDATMIDVTGIECKEGDSVEIFGENLPIQILADTLGTIPYEILTSVSPRVKRVYYRE